MGPGWQGGFSWKNLLSAAHQVDPEFYRLVTFAFCTGARQGNIVDLKWENVNLDTGTLYNETSKNGEPITTGLNERAKQILIEQRQVCSGIRNGRVWRWKNFSRKLWDEAVEKSGVKDIRFHDIRHHVVTQVANRHGIHIAKEVAHHKSIMTTQIYVNPTAEKVMQAFADIVVSDLLTII
jgi:integrase